MRSCLSWLRLFWGLHGRLNRRQLWLGNLILGFASTLIMMGLFEAIAPQALGGGYALDPVMILHAANYATLPFGISLVVRRAHDVGRSGWWVIVPFIVLSLWTWLVVAANLDYNLEFLLMSPVIVIGLVILAVLFFELGTPGPNAYGPQPREGWLP